MLGGFAVILYVLFGWFGRVISESQKRRLPRLGDLSFRYGMIWFIATEVMFFAAFLARSSTCGSFPYPFSVASGSSHGTTCGRALPVTGRPAGRREQPSRQWAPGESRRSIPPSFSAQARRSPGRIGDCCATSAPNSFSALARRSRSVSCSFAFRLTNTDHAYTELGPTMGAGAYGATFFMLTGFHEFHVTLGTIMLLVILLRSLNGHSAPNAIPPSKAWPGTGTSSTSCG